MPLARPHIRTIADLSVADSQAFDAVIIAVVAGGRRPAATDVGFDPDALERLSFTGAVGDSCLTVAGVEPRLCVLAGAGDPGELTPAAARRAGEEAARQVPRARRLAVDAGHLPAASARAFIDGVLSAGYVAGAANVGEVIAVTSAPDIADGAHQAALASALVRDLGAQPPSQMTPHRLAGLARELCSDTPVQCEVLEQPWLREHGFGGILGVASGSAEPACLIIARYAPPDAKRHLIVVGKGVTYDSGGLNLKRDPEELLAMKQDMVAGAAALASLLAVARAGGGRRVTVLVPAVENMPGPGALRPGDVLTHYGGITSEIVNADSEGRLIVADCLAWACEQRPDAIVDLGTLTGSVMAALGNEVTGLLSNDDGLAAELERAAGAAGEYVWRMPLHQPYRAQLHSDVADQRNGGELTAYAPGLITSSLFLERFVAPGVPWAHLDINGTAIVAGKATGAITRTLIEWMQGPR